MRRILSKNLKAGCTYFITSSPEELKLSTLTNDRIAGSVVAELSLIRNLRSFAFTQDRESIQHNLNQLGNVKVNKNTSYFLFTDTKTQAKFKLHYNVVMKRPFEFYELDEDEITIAKLD